MAQATLLYGNKRGHVLPWRQAVAAAESQLTDLSTGNAATALVYNAVYGLGPEHQATPASRQTITVDEAVENIRLRMWVGHAAQDPDNIIVGFEMYGWGLPALGGDADTGNVNGQKVIVGTATPGTYEASYEPTSNTIGTSLGTSYSAFNEIDTWVISSQTVAATFRNTTNGSSALKFATSGLRRFALLITDISVGTGSDVNAVWATAEAL